ncbi:nitric oxide-associated protein 1 [Onthophagus taurus]|uniref:nitric oxide-associated protein 1 n=1 Tax=Onthophagus taurus TaxID=166361 RepID=UPI0039BE454E
MFYKKNLILITLQYLRSSNIRYLSTRIQPKQEIEIKRFNDLLKKYQNSLLYSDYIENQQIKLGYHRKLAFISKYKTIQQNDFIKSQQIQPVPLSLKFINPNNEEANPNDLDHQNNESEKELFQLPYNNSDLNIQFSDVKLKESANEDDPALMAQKEIEIRYKNWMVDYENYAKDDATKIVTEEIVKNVEINYGTPDPKSNISKTPCGGCGAYLHCKDIKIPGYIPSEIFKNSNRFDGVSLKSMICQRCYFLREHNLALQVRVSPNDYPKILSTIQQYDRALIILIVDLLDFPCSIWPGAADLIGRGRPIFVVGNKIDLLPQDGKIFLERIETNLRNNLKLHGFAAKDIAHVALISAVTGFGVENLISKLQRFWGYRGDVFLIGCTNVGKSSLFNAMLRSDYCKVNAVDLVQRATISQWPGTTLNLLKFPINRPSGYKNYVRNQRLRQENKNLSEEKWLRMEQLKKTKNPKYANLIGHVGQTFLYKQPMEGGDIFSVTVKEGVGGENIGIDENDRAFAGSKWCYDTPGVIQSEQVLHLLTTEELIQTLPKTLIRPKTFLIQPETTIFIGGLSRLDFIKGEKATKFTVFCSSQLPVTICHTKDADEIYQDFLNTDFFGVPINDLDRLQKWPGLTKSKTFTFQGVDREISCADIVLSSSGWIAITPEVEKEVVVQGWVPPDCGIHLRDPLLSKSVKLRGKKIRDSVSYFNNKFYIPNKNK